MVLLSENRVTQVHSQDLPHTRGNGIAPVAPEWNASIGSPEEQIVAAWINRFEDGHIFEMRREKAQQILLALELIFMV